MILVTGGAGFIGANFIHEWLAGSDEAVLNVDKLGYAGNLANLADLAGDERHIFVQADVANQGAMEALLKQHRPRAIVHFAAESHVDRSIDGPQSFIDANIGGTFSLLEAARRTLPSRSSEQAASFRFLHVSTDEVFGTLGPDDPPFCETTPFAPNSPYSASKAASDLLVRAWHHTYGMPVLTTNCSNNYGPRQFPEKLVPLVITRALQGEPIPVYGDGLQVRDWLFVKDHCSALRRVLAAGEPGQTYNIGGNCERSNLEVVEMLCQLLDRLAPRADGLRYREQIRFVQDRPGHDRRYAINAGKMRQALGWSPSTGFEEGMQATVQWYLQHRRWVRDVQSGAYRQWTRPEQVSAQAPRALQATVS